VQLRDTANTVVYAAPCTIKDLENESGEALAPCGSGATVPSTTPEEVCSARKKRISNLRARIFLELHGTIIGANA
jgi:hypothetical protein